MAPCTGWAVAVDGKILIRTVSDTEVAATVNWLIGAGFRVSADATEEQILSFVATKAPPGTVLVPVIVSLKLDG